MDAVDRTESVAASRRRARRFLRAFARAPGVSDLPSVSQLAREKRDPYRILVATWISLRTKDNVTLAASKRLLALAPNPKALAALSQQKIERAIYPVAFYRVKSRDLRAAARRLVDDYNSVVPDRVEELVTFRGVGRKTATLVVSLGYGRDAICVDTHVHRVSNRTGLVHTRNPHQTEFRLMAILPRGQWIGINETLVRFGQKVCRPVSPICSACPARSFCPQVGVGRHR